MAQHVIYKIRNVVNGNFYVGSSSDYQHRAQQHRRLLRRNTHHCKHLQAAWNKYGEDCFKFEIVETVEEQANLQTAETCWLRDNVGKPHCYNSGWQADAPWRGAPKEKHPNFGINHTPYTKEQISIALKEYYAQAPENHPRWGKTLSEESKAKISANRKGKMAGADHYRYGKTVSDEVRAKIGDTQRGVPKAPRVISEEGMAKIRAAAAAGNYSNFLGKHHTEEAKAKMSRPVEATSPTGEVTTYPSITALRADMSLTPPTVDRALKSGLPLSKGARKGWSFRYV